VGYHAQPRPAGEPRLPGASPSSTPFRPWLLLLIPTLGGVASGVLVFTIAPEAEGHGTDSVIAAYHHRQGQIRPRVPLVKTVASSLTIGSGGSGGVFGPLVVIGGCGGGALGGMLHHWWPTLVPHPATFVIVGMAGLFAAAAKTPFSTLIIVSEMTSGYTLLLPSLWICALSFILSDEPSIYSSQVEGRSSAPAHRGSYVRQILANVRVRQFLSFERPTLTLEAGDPLSTALDRFARASSPVLPAVDGEHRLLGVVDLEEIHLASQAPDLGPLVVVIDMMRSDVRPLLPDDTLDRATELFVEKDLMALPIVDDLKRWTVLGLVRRFDIANTYVRYLHGPSAGGEPLNS